MASVANAAELDIVTCSICKDIFKNPVKISCNHSFCEDCIDKTWAASGKYTCPICRTACDGTKNVDFRIIQKMSELTINCSKCSKKVFVIEYRRHQRTHDQTSSLSRTPSRRLGSFCGSSTRRNIYTFPCPYCDKMFDREDLIRHVLAVHRDCDPKVVCPICKVMPWGDANKKSDNFFDHIKKRHQFDYDRFVDLNQSEEDSLRNALMLSLEQY
ncbi:E3 ubiquitin-protein ligase RNF114-like [Xenia sp. Carnegie-2017]|uniref:E3 ubiquitin-protein ligase RNF114-like n=1 Tax=Xenia sp. Carnegie-2017 TaxID=2897299 RepID=UPI001F03E0E6|nr:E3 ubiquitin-protein ligase RNF114-like [Xenia sp. Carnegie-2017]